MRTQYVVAVVVCSLGGAAIAQTPEQPDRGDAKALLQSGLKLFAAKDFLGALAVFRDAYERFPSSKILLNIGTTLIKLERKAEAANAYQGYLDAADGDPKKRAEVTRVLADLDRQVALLKITATPADAEIQIADGDWVPAATVATHRVPVGELVVRARRTGYQPHQKTISVAASESLPVNLVLAAVPVETITPVVTTGDAGDTGVTTTVQARPRARIGALFLAHIDPSNAGAAGLVGVTADLAARVQLQAAAILGPVYGAYAGASYAVLAGRLRPIVAVGIPVFFSDGARVGLRAAGGVEFEINRHLSLIAELGVEHVLNAEPSVTPTLFVPAIGASGRL